MSIRPPADPTVHSVLTSDVINETESTFKLFANKDGLVSQLDVVMLVRSMGMNPTDRELTELVNALQIRDPVREKQERIERDEREKKERELREKEKADAALQSDKKSNKAAPANTKASKAKGKEEEKPYSWITPERRPVVDWNKFISHVEPFYKDNKIEEEEIMQAFRVFDKEGKGWISRDELVRVMCTKGEEILAPPEVAVLLETFPDSRINFREFAQKMQGTWVEPQNLESTATGRPSTVRTAGPEGTALRPDGTIRSDTTGRPEPEAASSASAPQSGSG